MKLKNKSVVKPANPLYPPLHPALLGFDSLPDSSFVPLPVVCSLFSCSPATAWRRVKSGQLVAPHKLGLRTTRWNVGQLRQVLLRGDIK